MAYLVLGHFAGSWLSRTSGDHWLPTFSFGSLIRVIIVLFVAICRSSRSIAPVLLRLGLRVTSHVAITLGFLTIVNFFHLYRSYRR